MKRLAFFMALAIAATSPVLAQINIVPAPVSVTKGQGSWKMNATTAIAYPKGNADAQRVAEMLAQKLSKPSGYVIKAAGGATNTNATISLKLNAKEDSRLGKEGYSLKVDSKGITIAANQPAGLFYGVQTLLQLFPSEIESRTKTTVNWIVPAVDIVDYPRFAWRGLMFDVSRHFFNKTEVKQFIDDMVRYKYNLLHFHMTDDQGWRIEIKALPKLTEVGAWNVKKVGTFNYFSNPEPNEPRNYGGFFTHEDIKELVQYAKDHFVDVLPEVDVPGHSMAALAAYPELASTPGPFQVNSGEKFMEWPESGHFYGLVDNSLCPAKEEVYTFLDKVFTEVAALFPFPYIHMGGDETARNFWEKSEDIKKLMQREGLKNLDEVQSYFVKRVSKIVASKGKKLIGWDEIMDGGLAEGAVVMSWRGLKGGIEAAKQGHEVVMTPTTYCYLDYMQGDKLLEPPVYATLRLNKSYQFDPVPEGVDSKFVKGGQGNFWTEQIFNMSHAQYMVWPRGMAISEALWSQKSNRNWNDFVRRAEHQFTHMDAAGIRYAPSLYEPDVKVKKEGSNGLAIDLPTEIEGVDVHYSFDNSYPDHRYDKYTKASISVPKDAVLMRIVSYRNGKQVGRYISAPISELRKRAGYKD